MNLQISTPSALLLLLLRVEGGQLGYILIGLRVHGPGFHVAVLWNRQVVGVWLAFLDLEAVCRIRGHEAFLHVRASGHVHRSQWLVVLGLEE